MKYVNHDAPKPQTTHLGEQNWWWRPSASSSSRYDSWVLLMERHPASGPQAVYLSASFLELALQIQHMLTASFHLGKLKMSASNSQSPRTCTRAPFPSVNQIRSATSEIIALPIRFGRYSSQQHVHGPREQLEYRIDGAWNHVRLLHHNVHESLLRLRTRSQQRIPCEHTRRILFGKRVSVAVLSEWDGSGQNGWLFTKAESRMDAQNLRAFHICAQHVCKDANHMLRQEWMLRETSLERNLMPPKLWRTRRHPEHGTDSVGDGLCCPLQRPCPVHVRLARLLLQRNLAPEKNSIFLCSIHA